jgi:hypothetical protein
MTTPSRLEKLICLPVELTSLLKAEAQTEIFTAPTRQGALGFDGARKQPNPASG